MMMVEMEGKTKEEAIKEAVRFYTGRRVKKIEVVIDPRVEGTYAVRAKVRKDGEVKFLVTGWDGKRNLDPFLDMEEVDFLTWPPISR